MRTDLQDLNLGEFVQVMTLTALVASALTSLRNFVIGVVLVGSEKEMVRTYTRRVIALVQNLQSFGDSSEVEVPRQAMRVNLDLHRAQSGRKFQLSVLVATFLFSLRSRPEPASIFGLFNVLPESRSKVGSFLRNGLVALTAAIFPSSVGGGYEIATAH
jgi:hypothetical protein